MAENIKLFAYLNIEHPMVAWEVAIGRIKSICDDNEQFGISLWQYNLFKKYAQEGQHKKLKNELKLEKVRLKNHEDSISRLQGLYFFESEEDANMALDRWNMPHRKKYISEVYFSANSITRLDSEWITYNLDSDNDEWMDKYWSGEVLGEAPLTEVLASGIGIVQNMELRKQAYQNILNIWPESSALLAAASCTFGHEKIENIAYIKPAFIMKDTKLVGQYYISMGEFNKQEQKVIKSIQKCEDKKQLPPIIKHSSGDMIFSLPNLESEKFELTNPEIFSIYENIHE